MCAIFSINISGLLVNYIFGLSCKKMIYGVFDQYTVKVFCISINLVSIQFKRKHYK